MAQGLPGMMLNNAGVFQKMIEQMSPMRKILEDPAIIESLKKSAQTMTEQGIFKSLEEAHLRADQIHEREHVTFFLTEGKMPQIKMLHDKRKDAAPEYRVTLDTEEDLKLLKELIGKYQAHLMNADELIALFRAHPELKLINQNVVQKYY